MLRIFVNGAFDLLHPGHLKLLETAKTFYKDSYLLVAIDTDERIKKLKGDNRPIMNLANRKNMLEAIKWVDAVWSFDSDEELRRIIRIYAPHYMFKGADYENKPIIGADLVPDIRFVELTNDSTTKTIESITSR
jgi:D-beta-D-heptose 7-phosphate kinase/D-beta-D-heptose 1-phosphate adenosyltransferase